MADTAVTERRIRPILDAVSAKNWKQALKECEKWQKKGEMSDRFLALKASVLMHQLDEKQKAKGSSDTLQLCRRTPPVLNFEAIHQLQDSLRQLHLEAEEGPKLWERAVAARPHDEDLITTWLNNSISVSNWRNAQKATMALRKAAPKERQYDFWNISMCYLIHQDLKLPENDRKLFGTLANRMIIKAAQSGPTEKAVSNTEELSLLTAVLISTGSALEAVQLLQSASLRSVLELDPDHTQTLLLQAIQAAHDSSVTTQFLTKQFSSTEVPTEISEDDRIWALFVKSGQTVDNRQKALDQVDHILEKWPKNRQARLAKIDLLTTSTKDNRQTASSQLITACQEYYNLFGAMAFCFEDLIHRLKASGQDSVKAFQKIISTTDLTDSSSSVQQLFSLKLQYYLLNKDCPITDSLDFVSRALDLYRSTNDNLAISISPESGLLAALAMLRLASWTSRSQLVAMAGMILQTASAKFQDYYPLRILLLQVQMVCGQIHLGMQNFFHLSVKNLQWETVGHLLLTRISTLHPQQIGRGDEALSPLGALDTALNVFHNSQRSLDRAIRDGLKNGSYSNIIDTVELRNNLQHSIVRQLYSIEERKCQRILGLPGFAKYESHENGFTDLRDTSFMPKYGTDDEQLTALLQCGPRPSTGWVHAMAVHECLVAYLNGESGSSNSNADERALDDLRIAEAKASADVDVNADADDLTEDEKEAATIYRDLASITLQVAARKSGPAGSPDRSPSLKSLMACIGGLGGKVKPATLNSVAYPDWKYLHHQFVRLEMLRTVGQFAATLVKKLKTEKDKSKLVATVELRKSLEGIGPLLDEQVRFIHERVKGVKSGLSAPGVLGKLVDALLGRTEDTEEGEEQEGILAEKLAELQDEVAVEEYCGLIRESWEEALDGVLAVKIKTM